MSGKDRKTIREKLFLFLFFLNSILQLFDMILRKEENIIIKLIKQKKKKKKRKKKEKQKEGNCNSVYLTYLPHGSAH